MTANKKIPALRFKEFEGEWEEEKIGNCSIKVGSGSTPSGGEKVYTTAGVPFIRSQNIANNRLSLDNISFIPEEINDKMQGTVVKPLDILLNITGASIGRSCVVPSSFVRGNVNQHVCIIRLNSDNSPFFFQAYLSSTKGQNAIERSQVGSGREGLNFQSIRLLKLNIPKHPEQQKVASFLTSVDDKIQQLTKKKALLEQYKKGVLQQIFNQQIRFKDDDGNDYPDWEDKKLNEVTKIYDGTHMTPEYKESGIPFYSVEHVTSNNFSNTRFISEEIYHKENKRVKLEKGDILMTRIGDIGTSKYINWDVKASFYVSLSLIKNTTNQDAKFLNQYLGSEKFQRELHQRTIHVAFPKKINLGEIGECHIELPCLKEQQKIANFLTGIDNKIDLVNQQLEKTKAFKKGLLQRMFV